MLTWMRLFLATITFLILATSVWLTPPAAIAQGGCQNTITVTSTGDSGAGSLRQALADVCSGGTIDFAAGLANQTITLTSGELNVAKSVTIDNPNAPDLKVSGDNTYRVFHIQSGVVVTINSLRVINGMAAGSGGGILNEGDLTVNNSTFNNNSASSGGGIYNGNVLTVDNSTFTNNSAGEGGGILNGGVLALNNSTFTGNSATSTSGGGGGIYSSNSMTVNNSTFSGNSAEYYGGGIFNRKTGLIVKSNFSGNSTNEGGGGVFHDFGELTIINSTLSGNTADVGGAIEVVGDMEFPSVLTVNYSTLSGNIAIDGAGIYSNNHGGTTTLNNNTLSGNTADNLGGGIYNAAGDFIVNNSTLNNNGADTGGGITNLGNLYLRNSILANSSASTDCLQFLGGTLVANLNNLIEDGSCNPALSGDPNLGPLADNGGVTFTHALLPGSQAIDAGDNATCSLIDQRGFVRPVDGNGDSSSICDIGAVEMLATGLPADMILLGNNTVIPNNDAAPSLTDHTDFGSTSVAGSPITRTFTISNAGATNLFLTGSPIVSLTGHTADFILVTPPSTPVTSGGSTTFQVRFSPTALGLRTATLTLASNDPYENPYRFKIQGTGGCSPAVTVTSAGDTGPGTLRQALVNVCSGGIVDFAAGLTNQTITLTSAGLEIDKAMTITNPNASNLKINGNNTYRVFYIRWDTVVTMSNLTIINGASHDGSGIYVDGGATLTLNNSILSNNSSETDGGGIYNDGTLTVNNSTFNDNSADSGGGIYNRTTLTLNNSTFSGNSASDGGGLYNFFGNLTINNSTSTGNSAAFSGGGIYYIGGSLHLRNTIIANSPDGGDCYKSGTIAINLNNLIEDNSCNPAYSGDPNLSPLQNNGGSTPTHALLPGSPAIDAGHSGACTAGPINNLDQRGIARAFGSSCDIGAFESRGFTLAVSGGNNQSAPIGSPFAAPLNVTITSNIGSEPVNGGSVSFTGPGSDASTNPISKTFIVSGGAALANVTANSLAGGPYNVAAGTKGGNLVNFSLTNLKAAPAVTVTSSSNPSVVGQAVSFTAKVLSGLGTPSGNITFVIDGVPQPPVALSSGQATLVASILSTGTHTVSANYSGDDNFNSGSASLPGGQVVYAADTPIVQFTQGVYVEDEGNGLSQQIVLTRTGNLDTTSQVQVSLNGGTASMGEDYHNTGFPVTITFANGVVSQTVPITLIDDLLDESAETINLSLAGVSNAIIGPQSNAVLQIEDNDTEEAAPPSRVFLPLVIK